MQKILTYHVNDLAFDPDSIAETITRTCAAKTGPYRVRGVCHLGDQALFILLPLENREKPETYHLVLLQDTSSPGVISELEQRWEAGFDCTGCIPFGDGTAMMLYATHRDED